MNYQSDCLCGGECQKPCIAIKQIKEEQEKLMDIEIKVWVATNKVGSKCETYFKIDKEEWEGMNDKERDECCQESMWEMVEWDYSVVE